MPIYTRTGDHGQTSLFGGSRVLKSDERVEAYGTIDELNSMLGYANALLTAKTDLLVRKELEKIQQDLLVIGSALATTDAKPVQGLEKRSKDFEMLIDKLTNKIPPLQNFIVPGGGKAGSMLHVARTIARRAERRVVSLNQQKEIDPNILTYLNRLSDLLFTLARFVNYQDKQKEIIWRKK